MLSYSIRTIDAAPNNLLIQTSCDLLEINYASMKIQQVKKISSATLTNTFCIIPTKPIMIAASIESGVIFFHTETNELVDSWNVPYTVTSLHSVWDAKTKTAIIAAGTHSGNIYIVEGFSSTEKSFRHEVILDQKKSPVIDLKISPNAQFLIAIFEDKYSTLYEKKEKSWDLKCQRKYEGDPDYRPDTVCFSGNSESLLFITTKKSVYLSKKIINLQRFFKFNDILICR